MLKPDADSRTLILEAAAQEFAERGFAGVRMEHVAQRAGLNKSLVYRYFGDKEGLFREALRHQFREREKLLAQLPTTLPELLVVWSQKQRRDANFLRLIVREALEDQGDEPVEADARRGYYTRQVEGVRTLQKAGALDARLDPEMLFFALLAVSVAPVILPQIARLVAPGTERALKQRWERFLGTFARTLQGPA